MKKNAMPAGRQGFTLVELLVVIAIIATLVALAVPNYLGVRQRAQDSKTKSEMAELKAALRLYYNDYSKYPTSQAPGKIKGCGADAATLCPCTTNGSDFATGAACDFIYMKQMPAGLGSTILYKLAPGSTDDFCLSVLLNNNSDPDIATSQKRCASACGAASTKYWVCAD